VKAVDVQARLPCCLATRVDVRMMWAFPSTGTGPARAITWVSPARTPSGGAERPGNSRPTSPPNASATPATCSASSRSPERRPSPIIVTCTAPNKIRAPVAAVRLRYAKENSDRHASRLASASPAMALGRGEHVGEGKGARRNSPALFKEEENGKDAAVAEPMRDLKEAGVQNRHLSESEPSFRRPGEGPLCQAGCRGPPKPDDLPVTPWT
jgi:hypothetical protein